LPKHTWWAILARTPSTQALNIFTYSSICPGTMAADGSSTWMQPAPAATRA
jgi:hypothetical protein